MEDIETIELVHPQDITDKRFQIAPTDIMANLPYHPSCAMWFDHHALTDSNEKPPAEFRGKHEIAPSVARVVYSYYSPEKLGAYAHLVEETDRFDSANLTKEDILNPTGVILLGFTIDSRSGIGGFKEYFINLVERRAGLLRENNLAFLDLLKKHSRTDGNVVVTDFRGLETTPIGNRFLVYALFPEANVSLRLQWGPGKKFVAASLGHNIFNRTSSVHCGQVASDFGGGGHRGAAACPLDAGKADEQVAELVRRLKEAS
jgi:nanoRNase/pAp phosphatase (c-di-AMP/oligoRNAs hydrolase)